MSATLDGDAVAALMGGAPLVTSTGRQYPVETRYGNAYQLRESIVGPVAAAVKRALAEQSGSILVFLPGQREIKAVARQLAAELAPQLASDLVVSPLYGGLSLERQQQAIEPAPVGKRKVVLSTNIAETSL
jgi:ATP-dependent helicase HrpB